MSLKSGSLGLNLTEASTVILLVPWWNPAVENQATDRAFRIGQQKTVHVHKFVCTGTLEERIDQMIEQKMELAENIVGSGENWIIAGGKMKDVGTIEDGDGRWYAPNEGANNESNFTAIPAGFRLNDGQYYESGYYGIFWSSTAEYYTNAFFMWYLLHDESRLYRGLFESQTGLSVRCLGD